MRSKIKYRLTLFPNKNVSKDLLRKIGKAIIHYVLLRCNEILLIKIKDTVVKEQVNTKFSHETKHQVKGFGFCILA